MFLPYSLSMTVMTNYHNLDGFRKKRNFSPISYARSSYSRWLDLVPLLQSPKENLLHAFLSASDILGNLWPVGTLSNLCLPCTMICVHIVSFPLSLSLFLFSSYKNTSHIKGPLNPVCPYLIWYLNYTCHDPISK